MKLLRLVLFVGLIAGCTVVPGEPVPGSVPSPQTLASPSSTPADGASATVGFFNTWVRGRVYNQDGQLFTSGGTVSVESLEPRAPFNATVDLINGVYVVNQVPPAAKVQVTVSVPGHHAVSRVVTAPQGGGVTLMFGGPATQEDPDAPKYAVPTVAPSPLAKLPEGVVTGQACLEEHKDSRRTSVGRLESWSFNNEGILSIQLIPRKPSPPPTRGAFLFSGCGIVNGENLEINLFAIESDTAPPLTEGTLYFTDVPAGVFKIVDRYTDAVIATIDTKMGSGTFE